MAIKIDHVDLVFDLTFVARKLINLDMHRYVKNCYCRGAIP